MTGNTHLFLGGARSGKSALALSWANAFGPRRFFLATAEALGGEMSERIALHQTERAQASTQHHSCFSLELSPSPSMESRRMAPWKGHEGAYFLRPLASLAKACKRLRQQLHLVEAPLLLMHDRNDSISEFSNVFEIARRCASAHIEIRAFELRESITSKHMLVTHEQSKQLVCDDSVDFLKRVLGVVQE